MSKQHVVSIHCFSVYIDGLETFIHDGQGSAFFSLINRPTPVRRCGFHVDRHLNMEQRLEGHREEDLKRFFPDVRGYDRQNSVSSIIGSGKDRD
jgi:hypothetical protein